MRAFVLLLACWATIVCARPDVGGYNYNGNNNGIPQPANGQAQPQPQQLLPAPTLHQQQQLPAEHSFAPFGAAPAQQHFVDAQAVEQQAAVAEQSAHAGPDSYQLAHQQSAQAHESGYAYAPTPTKIHKHIYVHVPPKEFEEEDAVQPRVHHQAGPKQKHYKIVFIKAPSAPAVRAPIVPPLPQNEEKTLIYVLHKKPEATEDIVIPAPAPTKPSKPEVYFIKYKTRKEEAPVYGPPPAPIAPADAEPRHLEQPGNEYLAPAAASAPVPLAGDELNLGASISTLQPTHVVEEQPQQQAQPQFISGELPAELYNGPTMGTIRVEDIVQPTAGVLEAAAPAAPSAQPAVANQYLAPESVAPQIVQHAAPEIAVAEDPQQHVPSNSYGPPRSASGRYFIKKKK